MIKKETEKMEKKRLGMILPRDFKKVYATGAFGGWTPYDFRINFYNEVVMSEKEEPAHITDCQVILSPRALKELQGWLTRHVNAYEKEHGTIEIPQKEKK